jgi:hypothetical protein
MDLGNLLLRLINIQKKIDIKKLPSQGLFYKNDFEISIRKADVGDIIEYEFNFDRENLVLMINKIKKIVESNTIIKNGYSFNDIKSIDIVFLFIEIVKFTKGKTIEVEYFNDLTGRLDKITFDSTYFNYFTIDDKLMKYYDSENKYFIINGYRFSPPSIGIENTLTNYLVDKQYSSDAEKYSEYSYDFTFFMGDKSHLSFNEIENLIQIFNYDIDENEIKKIADVIKKFIHFQKYSLRKGDRVIDISSKLDLEKIWK